jgi:hypothetical protein
MYVSVVYIKKSKFIHIYSTHTHTHTQTNTVEVTDPLILAATVKGEGLAGKENKIK